MKSYDAIVIGGGTAGCVLANRLSEDHGRAVLLVEAGKSNLRLDVRAPAAFAAQFHSKVDWDFWTEPQPETGYRRLFSPRAKMLGGCSSMNAMIYIRGNRLDYDTWAAEGADGWSYDEVLPLFKRSEHNEQFSDAFHGTGGPLNVTQIRDIDPVSRALVDAAASIGIERNDDFNGERQEGTGQFQVTHRKGMRWSTAEGFLRPARRRSNLTVRTGAQVTRVVLDGDRASAIELKQGKTFERVGCSGEIILCAGAFNTPALLQHSGIGPAGHLRAVGIEALVDLPAVGENLMEHPIAYTNYELAGGRTGLFDAENPRHLVNWLLRRRGKLTSNIGETGAHVRTDAAMAAPNFQMLFSPAYFYEHGLQSWDAPAGSIVASFIAPESRGWVRVQSADPVRKPAVQLNMLSTEGEMAQMVDAIGLAREIAGAAAAAGVLGAELNPGPSVRTREEIAAWVRATAQHTYHPACTARIGSESDGVVDPQLRVHGVQGLRVADTSIMPTVTHGNTMAPAIMIGERCADLIRTPAAATTKTTAAAAASV
jgi:choline dehydrogenase